MCLWCEKLKCHCQPNALDSPQQAVVRKRHEDWLACKVIIQDLHKIATFLWPKFNQLRMLSHSDRIAVHAHAHNLLQAMAAGALDVEIREAELSGVEPTPPPAKRADFVEWENVQLKMTRSLTTLKRLSWKIKWMFLAGGRSTNHPNQNLQN